MILTIVRIIWSRCGCMIHIWYWRFLYIIYLLTVHVFLNSFITIDLVLMSLISLIHIMLLMVFIFIHDWLRANWSCYIIIVSLVYQFIFFHDILFIFFQFEYGIRDIFFKFQYGIKAWLIPLDLIYLFLPPYFYKTLITGPLNRGRVERCICKIFIIVLWIMVEVTSI